ncbi:MAG: hypothetical protein LIO94_09525 [Clostridiales bacterium]|nr:hypothetical protein [Clostridiales bacterium]
MANYGLTDSGPNPKRLDVILEEMHSKLSDLMGVNTRLHQQSLLNHLLTNIADEIAELWEYGTDVYYSQYPSSAEGSSLDNALQFGGITREQAAKSYYKILCTGLDGTTIPSGTIIASDTNPATNLVLDADAQITRSDFSTAVVILATESSSSTLNVVVNNVIYAGDTLEGIAEAMADNEDFTVSYEDGKLTIVAVDETSSNVLVLSENLTTETVGTIVSFATEEYGDILIPDGVVTKIVNSVAGLQNVSKVRSYIAGRLLETDTEFRQSHLDKIYNQSSRMLESIRSAILENCQGVESVAPYENDTNETDEMGRPPHSIEIVVDGGDKEEIAQQIFDTKAGGISTYCSEDENGVTVTLKGSYGEDIDIRFSRPSKVYVWFQIGITLSSSTNLPTNYAELIKETLLDCMDDVDAGSDVVPQKFTTSLYSNVPGVDYFDIRLFSTRDSTESPDDYTERSVSVTARERAYTTESMIGVVIDA